MEIALVHRVSMNILARFTAKDSSDACLQYLHLHPEFECDTWDEFCNSYPVLSMAMLSVPIQ